MISIRASKQFCSEPLENIENYDNAVADVEHLWECHHRAEILPCGVYSREDLKKVGLYWHRPAKELIFLRHDEHRSLHHMGKVVSQDTRRKMSESHKGKGVNHPALSTPVEMTRLADGLVKVFPSQREAARWLVSHGYPNASSICECCKGKRKTSAGCRWRYVR